VLVALKALPGIRALARVQHGPGDDTAADGAAQGSEGEEGRPTGGPAQYSNRI